jgi:hypothetical protein
MSDRELMIEVIEEWSSKDGMGQSLIPSLADRLIGAGFRRREKRDCPGCVDSQVTGARNIRPHTCGTQRGQLV